MQEDLKPKLKFETFQLRWNEPLGKPECPYAHRYVLNLGLFAIRIHRWHRSDDKRFMHDHPYWFLTFVLKGGYTDVSQNSENVSKDVMRFGSFRFRKANHRHYVQVDVPNTITVLITGRPVMKWGFWVDGKLKRPMKYFHKYGHPPCDEA